VFFALRAHFRIEQLVDAARTVKVDDYYDRLALDRAMDRLAEAEHRLSIEALATGRMGAAAVEAWAALRQGDVERTERAVADIAGGSQVTLSRIAVAAGVLGDLARARA
jgi:glutamate dehydrogenase